MQSSLAQLRRAAVEIGIFSLFINVLMLVMPLYMLQVYDRVIPSSSTETLVYLSVMAVGALVLIAVLEGVRGIYANRVAAGFDLAQSRNAILASMASPRAALGDIQLLRDIASLRAYVASRGAFAFFDLPFTPIFVGLLWFVHPLLFALTVAGAVILVVVALVNQWAMAGVTRRATENGIAAMTTAQSFVRNSETLRAMGMIDNAIAAWARHHNPALVAGDELARLNAFFSGLARFLRLGLQIAILGVGGWLVVHGQMTAGMIFASSIISGRALQPLDQVIGGWRQFVDARGAWQRVRKGAAAVARGDYTELPDPKGRIDIEDLVYFVPNAGPKSEAILKRINLSFPAGSVTCIIGPSGAGKSTLARLLVGAIPPRSGVIRLDGADIAHWQPERLGRHIGYLPQDVELFPGTVAENICRFAPDASGEAIVAAARHAQVHDLILSLPDGYDTLIGPLGMMLSGGQRQRIGLARAFYGAPAMLVLDEPNASLDSEGEAALERAIDAARAENATVVLITQRGAVARKADALLIMRDGVVADYGPREEVIARQQKAGSDEAARAKAAANANGVSGPKPAGAPGAKTSPFSAFGPGLRPLPPKNPKSSGNPDT